MQTPPDSHPLEQDDIVQRFLTSQHARIPRHVVGVLMVLILTVVPRISEKH